MRDVRALRCTAVAAIFCCAFATAACNRDGDATMLGTFRMGEKVQAGPLVYTVTEANWKPVIDEAGRLPANRFLFLHVAMTNTGAQPIAVPGLELVGSDGKSYVEQTEGMQNVVGWLSAFRNLAPGQTVSGWVVFDAPVGAYQLSVSDAGEIGSEKRAHIDIPVQLN